MGGLADLNAQIREGWGLAREQVIANRWILMHTAAPQSLTGPRFPPLRLLRRLPTVLEATTRSGRRPRTLNSNGHSATLQRG